MNNTCLHIIIIMSLRSVSASKDVIGDPSRPGINNSELLEPRREEQEKVLGKRASGVMMYCVVEGHHVV